MAYLATFHWGWLLGSLLLGLGDGLDRGGSSRPGRIESRLTRWLAVLAAALVAAALARVVPGRFGYWLDLGLIMFALYLVRLRGRILAARLGGFAQRARRPEPLPWPSRQSHATAAGASRC